jgi:hypothetical protein
MIVKNVELPLVESHVSNPQRQVPCYWPLGAFWPAHCNSHYRRRVLCLGSHALPSAFHRTLGKEAGLPSVALGKQIHTTNLRFAECQTLVKVRH